MSEAGPVTCEAEVLGPAEGLRMACAVTAPPGEGLLVIDAIAWLHLWARRRGLQIRFAAIDPALVALVEFCGLDRTLHCERAQLGADQDT